MSGRILEGIFIAGILIHKLLTKDVRSLAIWLGEYDVWAFIFWVAIILTPFAALVNSVKIAALRDEKQREIIDNQSPKKLNLTVGASPMKGWHGEKNVHTVYLTVISHENKKIVEFHAKRLELLQRTANMKPDLRGATFGHAVPNFRFLWEKGAVFTELIPGDRDELLIAELDPELGYPVFGQPKASTSNSDEPSIYEVYLRFKGKFEGEDEFAYYDYRTEIYCHPAYEVLDFADAPDIPDELKTKVLFTRQ